MQTTYSDEDRIDALALLRHNRDDAALTSSQTGVPEHTLRQWRRSQRHENCQPPMRNILIAICEAAQFENRADVLEHVYNVVRREVADANSLLQQIDGQPTIQKLRIVMQMHDRLELLRLLLSDTPLDQIVHIEVVAPDGSVHAIPHNAA